VAFTSICTSMSTTRVAIVTGAAQGIGRAISLRLAQDGCDVVVNDLPSKAKELDALVLEIVAKNRRSLAVVGDASSEKDVQNLVGMTITQLGGLDVMVANAGIARNSPLTSTSVEEWDFIQTVNVRSTFLCYKAAAVQMIKQGRGGRIIGASSQAGKHGAREWGPYCASKFAVRGLTQSAAAEFGQYGITVNAYAPGAVDTPLWKDIEESRKEHGLEKRISPAIKEGLIIPPEDIAGLVSYLVSEEAKFVTGQSMNINAGKYFD